MTLTRAIAGVLVAGGLGAAALGIGAGVAAAQPGPPGPGGPGGPGHGPVQGQGPPIPPGDRPAFERAVHDHRPFQYQGRWVNPIFDPGRGHWGFWFGPLWIPLFL